MLWQVAEKDSEGPPWPVLQPRIIVQGPTALVHELPQPLSNTLAFLQQAGPSSAPVRAACCPTYT